MEIQHTKKLIIIGLIALVVIVLVTAVLHAISSSNTAPSATQTIQISQIPTPTSIVLPAQAQTILSIQNPTIATANIQIDTGSNSVVGARIALSFPPNEFSYLDIIPRLFFKRIVVLKKTVDLQKGQLIYSIAIPDTDTGSTGKGFLATLTFIKANDQDPLRFQFTKDTYIVGAGVPKTTSLLKQTTGL